MERKIYVSTPSRICLFGEHQDYLGLEVIAAAINLRFYAAISSREDNIIRILSSGEKYGKVNTSGDEGFRETIIDLSEPIIYTSKRDYLKSTVKTLLNNGYKLSGGYDIVLDSEIPIGKGMCSSSTMIVVLIKALLEAIDSFDKNNLGKIAQLGFMAEVLEFDEPGGMMDHYTSAVGGLLHIDFSNGQVRVNKINKEIPGCFILFDSMARKNTTQVLANAKNPVVNGLLKLKQYGINSIRDFIEDEDKIKLLKYLNLEGKRKIETNIDNYRILLEGEKMLTSEEFSPEAFGELLRRHHENLRDGLNISTSFIEEILAAAYKNGALGGKINGSGGGGCAFVYCMEENSEGILNEVGKLGYKGTLIRQDTGVRKDREGIVR